MAELVDAPGLGSGGSKIPWRFESSYEYLPFTGNRRDQLSLNNTLIGAACMPLKSKACSLESGEIPNQDF